MLWWGTGNQGRGREGKRMKLQKLCVVANIGMLCAIISWVVLRFLAPVTMGTIRR